jgi:hypothetical protein
VIPADRADIASIGHRPKLRLNGILTPILPELAPEAVYLQTQDALVPRGRKVAESSLNPTGLHSH